ncbi:NUDIX domain-containing protein [Kitasatospora sp. NPDC094028]
MSTDSRNEITSGVLGAAAQVHAALLLVDDHGRVLISQTAEPQRESCGLPGGPSLFGESPATAAARAAEAPTGLPSLTAGRLLAVDWHPGTDPSTAGLRFIYDHPPLTAGQAAALGADPGLRNGPRLVHPKDLAEASPDQASRILAALHARVDGSTADLESGQPRTPSVLDRHHLLTHALPGPATATWKGGPAMEGTVVEEVRGWLFAPDGRVVLVHDPATRTTFLPGGSLEPDESEAPETALVLLADSTARAMISFTDRFLLGHHVTGSTASARIVTTVKFVKPLSTAPDASAPLRLLVSPEQAVDLLGGGKALRAEMAAAVRLATQEIGLPDAGRYPVTELPAEGRSL